MQKTLFDKSPKRKSKNVQSVCQDVF